MAGDRAGRCVLGMGRLGEACGVAVWSRAGRGCAGGVRGGTRVRRWCAVERCLSGVAGKRRLSEAGAGHHFAGVRPVGPGLVRPGATRDRPGRSSGLRLRTGLPVSGRRPVGAGRVGCGIERRGIERRGAAGPVEGRAPPRPAGPWIGFRPPLGGFRLVGVAVAAQPAAAFLVLAARAVTGVLPAVGGLAATTALALGSVVDEVFVREILDRCFVAAAGFALGQPGWQHGEAVVTTAQHIPLDLLDRCLDCAQFTGRVTALVGQGAPLRSGVGGGAFCRIARRSVSWSGGAPMRRLFACRRWETPDRSIQAEARQSNQV